MNSEVTESDHLSFKAAFLYDTSAFLKYDGDDKAIRERIGYTL